MALIDNTYNSDTYLREIFGHRKQGYGAVAQRKSQITFTNIAWLCAVSFVVIGFASPVIWRMFKDYLNRDKLDQIAVVERKIVSYSELSAPPPIELETPKPQELKQVQLIKSTLKFLKPEIRKDEEVPEDELLPTKEELAHTDPGVANVKGNDSIVYSEPVDIVEISETEKPEAPREIFAFSEIRPSFPGGEESFYAFLYDHLKYPSKALENGIEGQVVVQFVVEKNGNITQTKIVRGIGWGCDEEALRVVQLIPKWVPGSNNRVPVAVKFVIPIRFVLML